MIDSLGKNEYWMTWSMSAMDGKAHIKAEKDEQMTDMTPINVPAIRSPFGAQLSLIQRMTKYIAHDAANSCPNDILPITINEITKA
jgi:hypothetical protein